MIDVKDRAAASFLLLIALLLLIGIGGFSIFRAFLGVRSIGFENTSLIVLSIAAGTASFFSPCSFPLLLTLVARDHGQSDGTESRPRLSLWRGLRFAAGLSVGFIVFLSLLGLVIALGAGPVVAQVGFASTGGRLLRGAAGAALVLLGLIQTGRISANFHRVADAVRPLLSVQARLRRRRPTFGYALFGFAYVLAGFG